MIELFHVFLSLLVFGFVFWFVERILDIPYYLKVAIVGVMTVLICAYFLGMMGVIPALRF